MTEAPRSSARSPGRWTASSSPPAGRPMTRPFRAHLTVARSDGVPAGADVATPPHRGGRRRRVSGRPNGSSSSRASPAADRPATSRCSRRDRDHAAPLRCGRHPRARLRVLTGSQPGRGGPHGAVRSAADEVRPRRIADPGCLVQHRRRPAACRRRRLSTRARSGRSARTTSRRCSRWRSSARRSSAEREIEIPEPVRDAYRLYRPSPLYRAHRLEQALDTPAHIYYKYEGVSPAGSHKPNTALAAGLLQQGGRASSRLATETGAGQWGSALAFAGACFGLEVKVYMVRASYDQKPYRRILMETYGAEVVAEPVADDELRPAGPRRDARQPGLARDRDQRGGRGRRRAATTRSTRSARCSTTSSSTRPSSARRRIEQMAMAGE